METVIVFQAQEQAGWDHLSVIAVLLRYIREQKDPGAFQDFISQQVQDELTLTSSEE